MSARLPPYSTFRTDKTVSKKRAHCLSETLFYPDIDDKIVYFNAFVTPDASKCFLYMHDL